MKSSQVSTGTGMRHALVALVVTVGLFSLATAQESSRDLAAIKQQEARENLKAFEETMDRLSRLLATSEPQNAVKLRTAFRMSRERLIREGMDRVVQFLAENKLDRAIEDQRVVTGHLQELLGILLEKDIDPRELIRHIRRVRDVLKDLDEVVKEETEEKLASDNALAAKSAMAKSQKAAAQLNDLIAEQKKLESKAAEHAKNEDSDPAALEDLQTRQDALKKKTGALRKNLEAQAQTSGSPSAAATSLAQAESEMAAAAAAAKAGQAGEASKRSSQARKKLEEALGKENEHLEKLRQRRDFAAMQEKQDATKVKTDGLLERMRRTPPLIVSPEEGIPGRKDVQEAAGSMSNASGQLAEGQAGPAGTEQKKALDALQQGREKTEQTLEALQQALRERVLAYLKKRITVMLERQKRISRKTTSLDQKLRALATAQNRTRDELEIDRKDLRTAQSLSEDEGGLAMIAEDVVDLLEEDGTTLVFPRIVGSVRQDLLTVQGLLENTRTGVLTQRIQKEIETTLEEILAAIEQAQKNPPPPNPNQGRDSKNGTSPLLPASAELKMILSMQIRVNERTEVFERERSRDQLSLEEQRHAKQISASQRETRDLMRKISQGMGE